MTDPMTQAPDPDVVVTQEDREAALNLSVILFGYGHDYTRFLERGGPRPRTLHVDAAYRMIQAFARHRQAAIDTATPLIEARVREACAAIVEMHGAPIMAKAIRNRENERDL